MTVNEPQKNKYFQSEIDNTTGASTVINLMIGETYLRKIINWNIILGLLKDSQGEKVGIIQLVNHNNGKAISKEKEVTINSKYTYSYVFINKWMNEDLNLNK